MLGIAAVLELFGVVIIGLPAFRILGAHRRVDGILGPRESELDKALIEVEKHDLAWPHKWESFLIVFGICLCAVSAVIKVIYYFY